MLACDVFWGAAEFGGQGVATGGAELGVFGGGEVVIDADAFVKDIAVAFPHALFCGDFFDVFEDAAFEVVDIFKALVERPGGGSLAADATGAEHGDLFVDLGIVVAHDELWELAETGDFWIDGTFKGACVELVVVAGVDEDDFWIGDQGVPVFGFDVLADMFVGVGVDADVDEGGFDFDFGAVEDWGRGVAGFVGEVFEALVGPHDFDDLGDGVGEATDGAVDAFFCEEDGAEDVSVDHVLFELRGEGVAIVDVDELVEGNDFVLVCVKVCFMSRGVHVRTLARFS